MILIIKDTLGHGVVANASDRRTAKQAEDAERIASHGTPDRPPQAAGNALS